MRAPASESANLHSDHMAQLLKLGGHIFVDHYEMRLPACLLYTSSAPDPCGTRPRCCPMCASRPANSRQIPLSHLSYQIDPLTTFLHKTGKNPPRPIIISAFSSKIKHIFPTFYPFFTDLHNIYKMLKHRPHTRTIYSCRRIVFFKEISPEATDLRLSLIHI